MYIKVNLTPDAKKDLIRKAGPDKYNINVKDKPIRNLANKKMLTVLATELKVTPEQLRVVKGHHQQSKLISLQQKLSSVVTSPNQMLDSKKGATKTAAPKSHLRFKV